MLSLKRIDLPGSPILRYFCSPLPLRDALLIGLTLIALVGVCKNGYVNLDDKEYVTENLHVLNGLNRDSVVWAFTTKAASNWHPLTWLSLQLDASILGPRPVAFHGTNFLLHLINVLLLAEVLRRLTGAIWRAPWWCPVRGPPSPCRVCRLDQRTERPAQHAVRLPRPGSVCPLRAGQVWRGWPWWHSLSLAA